MQVIVGIPHHQPAASAINLINTDAYLLFTVVAQELLISGQYGSLHSKPKKVTHGLYPNLKKNAPSV